MKATLHFPTEQYGFAEIEVEVTSVEEAIEMYRSAPKVGSGIDDRSFDTFIERQLGGETNELDTYQKMSPEQQKLVQVNKRALKRLEAKINRV